MHSQFNSIQLHCNDPPGIWWLQNGSTDSQEPSTSSSWWSSVAFLSPHPSLISAYIIIHISGQHSDPTNYIRYLIILCSYISPTIRLQIVPWTSEHILSHHQFMKPIAVDCQLNHVHFILIANSIRYNILLIFNRSNRTVLFNQIKPLYKIITTTIYSFYMGMLYSNTLFPIIISCRHILLHYTPRRRCLGSMLELHPYY